MRQPRIGKRRLAARSLRACLHHRAHVLVDLVDVGVLAELRGDVDRFQHLSDDLGGQRDIRWDDRAEPEWEAERDRQDGAAQQALDAQPLGQPGAAGQVQLGLLAADGHRGNDRHAGLDRRADIALAAVEVDDVLRRRRPVGVVVTAGKDDHHAAGAQRFGGVLPVGPDVAGPPEQPARQAHEQDVVAQRVDRPLVAELVVEVDAEDRDIHREHSAGVVADHQCAAGREGVQAVHLGAEIPLQHRAQHTHQALGQPRVELADLGVLTMGIAHFAHRCPLVASCESSRVESLDGS